MKNPKLKNLIGMCLNWKGLLAVVVIGAFLFYFFSPQKALAYLPLLFLAVCPLSMLFGIRMMGKNNSALYACPMHPKVLKDKSGTCPECGMNLVPKNIDR